MRVAFLDPLEARLAEFPQRYLGDHEVLLTDTAGSLPDGVETAEAVVWWQYPVDAVLIDRLTKLRFMQRIGIMRTRGDTSRALQKGIPVSAIPHGVSDRVALHALTLTLTCLRKVLQTWEGMQQGLNPDNLPQEETHVPSPAVNWTRTPDIDTLNDKTVGIIGFGEIGAALTRLIRPFDCRVLYHKRSRLGPEIEAYFGIEYASLDELLSQSDVIEATIPYSESSRKMIGAREFGLMKPTATFINVGRGNTVDEVAMIEVLQAGRIAMAGLDVFAVEPLPVSSPLLQLKNVVLSPHSAGGTAGWTNTFERLASQFRRIEAGEPPIQALSASDPQPPFN